MHIRSMESTDSEYEASVAVWNANWPDYLETAEEWKGWDASRNPDYFFQRLVGEIDGKFAAIGEWGQPSWAFQPGKYYWSYEIHPVHAHQGLEEQMHDHIMELIATQNPTKLVVGVRDDKVDRVRFVEERDYVVVQREPTSRLNIADFDPAHFRQVVERVQADGIKIYKAAEVRALDPNWKHNLWDLAWAILQDVPSHDEPTREPFEQFEKRVDNPEVTSLDTRFVAIDTTDATEGGIGTYVGLSNLDYNKLNTKLAHTGLTGLVRSHRRRGIATALKVHAISCVARDGIEQIDTDNDENNPMLQLNIQLGFKPGPTWLSYEKTLTERNGENNEFND